MVGLAHRSSPSSRKYGMGPDLGLFVPIHGTSAPRGGPSVGGSWLLVGRVVLPSGIRPHLW